LIIDVEAVNRVRDMVEQGLCLFTPPMAGEQVPDW